jgi:hypothetical protein
MIRPLDLSREPAEFNRKISAAIIATRRRINHNVVIRNDAPQQSSV